MTEQTMEHMQVLAFLSADGSHSRMREAFPDAPKQPLSRRAARREAKQQGRHTGLRTSTATALRTLADRLEPTGRRAQRPAPQPA
jgi:hypothetical protein